ncbi:MAG: phage baseplate protein [Leptolyngbyaceae cyanobacterium SL_7_1]|nr:phage baseplate protein [Leptolyngbyaceae cyanobacterium SL_7_1]
MQCLSADQILQVWELGQTQHPIDRALTLLGFALPDRSRQALSRLSIGQRDALLLRLRQRMFGEAMESFAVCPSCGESLEFTLKATELRLVEPSLAEPPAYEWSIADYTLTVTLPTSQDLAAVVDCSDLATAQATLTQRCIQQVSCAGVAIAPHSLPDAVLQQLAQQMADSDPQAELGLDLTCPACQSDWQVVFDIATFFWTELSVQAKRLLREVHRLARSYGWREADILAMSAMRRQFYLDLVDA